MDDYQFKLAPGSRVATAKPIASGNLTEPFRSEALRVAAEVAARENAERRGILKSLIHSERAPTDQSETHPGAIVDISARDNGWREGIANAWRACEHAETAQECRTAIEALGNRGPK